MIHFWGKLLFTLFLQTIIPISLFLWIYKGKSEHLINWIVKIIICGIYIWLLIYTKIQSWYFHKYLIIILVVSYILILLISIPKIKNLPFWKAQQFRISYTFPLIGLFVIAWISFVSIYSNNFDNKLETDNFIFYYSDNDSSSIESFSITMEKHFIRICNHLKPSNMPKIKVKIFESIDKLHFSFYLPFIPSWATATCWSEDEIRIVSPNNSPNNQNYNHIEVNAVHEFTHCIVKNICGKALYCPVWLNEGIPLYEAGQMGMLDSLDYLKGNRYPHLSELNNWPFDLRVYDVGFYIIDYIIEKWGNDKLIELIKSRGNINKVLDIKIEEFEKEWNNYTKSKYMGDKLRFLPL